MTIQLPSGRKLYYPHPHLGVNRFGHESICYLGVNQTSRKWMQLETYGGKLVENITQAVARDCLAEAVERLEAHGALPVVFHVHDEVVLDVEQQYSDLDAVVQIMSQNPTWAKGLPLGADGWVDYYYKKD
jgi:DNA polymerase